MSIVGCWMLDEVLTSNHLLHYLMHLQFIPNPRTSFHLPPWSILFHSSSHTREAGLYLDLQYEPPGPHLQAPGFFKES